MKSKYFFLFFTLYALIHYSSQFKRNLLSNETFQLVSVLSDSIHEIFTKLEIKFEFIVYQNVSLDTLKVLDILLRTLQVPAQLRSLSLKVRSRKTFSNSAVIFLNSLKELKDFYHDHSLDFDPTIHPKKIRFLFFVTKPFKVNKIGVNAINFYGGSIAHYSYFVVNYKGKKINLWQIEKKLFMNLFKFIQNLNNSRVDDFFDFFSSMF